jgi:hypothetical protein
MARKQYNPRFVTFVINPSVGASHAVTGYAADTFISAVPDSDNIIREVDANGVTTTIINNNNNWTITLTLSQASPTNDFLSGLVNQTRLTGIVTSCNITIRDNNGSTVLTSSDAVIQRQADGEFATTNTNRVWIISASECNTVIGGLNDQ